jgi:hypothetical protein
MPRYFNTAGPNNPESHYTVPASARLPDARELIERQGYFVVHAPRQTGKTTTLRALAKELTAEGRYAALHFTCEAASVAGDDYGAAMRSLLFTLRRAAARDLPPELQPPPFPDAPNEQLLAAALSAWAAACPRPLVLVFDEIDSLVGQSLISVLRQLRAGFPDRPQQFPWSVILCGMRNVEDYVRSATDSAPPGGAPPPRTGLRPPNGGPRDVRDYKLAAGGNPPRIGSSSPFNIKVESSRLGDFSPGEVRELYGQHTAESGQLFTEEAILRAHELSAGQPWLVNALGREIVDKMKVPASEPITPAHLDAAKERLILARATHLDSLLARLTEPRIQRILEPLIAGDTLIAEDLDDDVKYARDLGLIARTNPVRVANPIYREVIVRVLAGKVEANVTDEPRAFVLPDGRLAFRKLLRAFGRFWREHGAALLGATPYHEVAAQLVFMAFLQRIVNGGGYVDREYGVGRGRIDLLVRWPYRLPDGRAAVQRRAIEIKVWRPRSADPLNKGLSQLDGYLSELGLRRGTLVIFDRRNKAVCRPRFLDTTTRAGRTVRLLRA